MGNIHFVKHARKDNPVAKKGESYWWWSIAYDSEKHYSKTKPTSQQIMESYYPVKENA